MLSENGFQYLYFSWIYVTLYVYKISVSLQASFGAVCSSPMPDENLDYRNILETTKKVSKQFVSVINFLHLRLSSCGENNLALPITPF